MDTYRLGEGSVALTRAIALKRLPPAADILPTHKLTAASLRAMRDAGLIFQARKKLTAARRLQDETARKRKEAIEERFEQFTELEQAQHRRRIMRKLLTEI